MNSSGILVILKHEVFVRVSYTFLVCNYGLSSVVLIAWIRLPAMMLRGILILCIMFCKLIVVHSSLLVLQQRR